jgi:ubiquinone/menaquinone biosynthesis C-methylase UbiE
MSIPTKASTDTSYRKDQAESYDTRRFTSRSGIAIHNVELSMLRKALEWINKNSSIIEVGCGTGRLLIELCNNGYYVDGIDASPYMLNECTLKLGSQFSYANLTTGEAASLPYSTSTYDFVYAIRLLNQTGSKKYALDVISEMIRVAKPNGYVLVEFVNYYRPRFKGYNDLTVRLKPTEVLKHAAQCGGTPIWCRGAFLLGMTGLHNVPDRFVDLTGSTDRILSRFFPKLCARCYLFLKKR